MRIPWSEIKIAWEIQRWDGPVEGICLYQGSHYYFNMYSNHHFFEDSNDENDKGFFIPRTFLIYPMTMDDWKREVHWHDQFLEYVASGKYTREQFMKLYYEPYWKEFRENPRNYTSRDRTFLRPIGYTMEGVD